jgi:hypothetical protein
MWKEQIGNTHKLLHFVRHVLSDWILMSQAVTPGLFLLVGTRGQGLGGAEDDDGDDDDKLYSGRHL